MVTMSFTLPIRIRILQRSNSVSRDGRRVAAANSLKNENFCCDPKFLRNFAAEHPTVPAPTTVSAPTVAAVYCMLTVARAQQTQTSTSLSRVQYTRAERGLDSESSHALREARRSEPLHSSMYHGRPQTRTTCTAKVIQVCELHSPSTACHSTGVDYAAGAAW